MSFSLYFLYYIDKAKKTILDGYNDKKMIVTRKGKVAQSSNLKYFTHITLVTLSLVRVMCCVPYIICT
jgi:hypothetical protein